MVKERYAYSLMIDEKEGELVMFFWSSELEDINSPL